MLNRWWSMRREISKPKTTRPTGKEIYSVNSLSECEKWRNSLLKDISKLVTVIQNAGLGEHRIREVNDEINSLLKEKNMFENKIRELGGPDYKKAAYKLMENEGEELPGYEGYKYFGAAKDLPGVRELF